jgi:hypothetical protein
LVYPEVFLMGDLVENVGVVVDCFCLSLEIIMAIIKLGITVLALVVSFFN